MKKSAGSLLLIIILLLNIRTAAQGQAALQFLTYPFSPLHSSMGSTGTSLPADNAFGFLYNPAQLGYTSQKTNLVFQFYPEESKILDFISLNGLALNAGYNFIKLINIPLSIGFGYADNKMVYNFISEDEDSYRAYSVGVGIDYYVKFSLGYTYKDITSKIASTGVKNIDGEYGFQWL